ncbi:MAG: hypothetical protein ACI9BD_001242 [Candidatus Marinamargulisbacteria bacterium]|jgi:hypothetical protein
MPVSFLRKAVATRRGSLAISQISNAGIRTKLQEFQETIKNTFSLNADLSTDEKAAVFSDIFESRNWQALIKVLGIESAITTMTPIDRSLDHFLLHPADRVANLADDTIPHVIDLQTYEKWNIANNKHSCCPFCAKTDARWTDVGTYIREMPEIKKAIESGQLQDPETVFQEELAIPKRIVEPRLPQLPGAIRNDGNFNGLIAMAAFNMVEAGEIDVELAQIAELRDHPVGNRENNERRNSCLLLSAVVGFIILICIISDNI